MKTVLIISLILFTFVCILKRNRKFESMTKREYRRMMIIIKGINHKGYITKLKW